MCWNCGDECGIYNVLCDCSVMSYVQNDAMNRTSHCICHILYHHSSTPPDISHHVVTFHILHYGNISHTRTPHSTLHRIPHDAFCISIKTPCLKLQHSTSHHISFTYTDITPHFTSHYNSHQITVPHLGTPFHITPTFHLTPPCTHHIQI